MKLPNAAHNFSMDGTARLVGLNQQSAFCRRGEGKGRGSLRWRLFAGAAARPGSQVVGVMGAAGAALAFAPAGSFYYQTVGMGGPLGNMGLWSPSCPMQRP